MAQRRTDTDSSRKSRKRNEREIDISNIPRAVSVFGGNVIDDLEIFPTPAFLFIQNRADKLPDSATIDPNGKPDGMGLAGGGVQEDRSESIEDGCVREINAETGLDLNTNHLYYIVEERGKIHYTYTDRVTGEQKKRSGSFEWNERPQPKARRGETVTCINPMFFYMVTPVWEGSPQQKLFREEKRRLLASGQTEQDIQTKGIFIDLTVDEAKALGIKEHDEMDGMALLPLMRVAQEFDYPSQSKGNRWYPYYFHTRMLKVYGKSILDFYAKLKTDAVPQATALIRLAEEVATSGAISHPANLAEVQSLIKTLETTIAACAANGHVDVPRLTDATKRLESILLLYKTISKDWRKSVV